MVHSFEDKLFWCGDEQACAQDWKQILDTDANAAAERLRALERRLELTDALNMLDKTRTDCLAALDGLFRTLDSALTAFPSQEGIFLREHERRQAYRLICGLFAELEPIDRSLSAGTRAFLAVKGALLNAERAILSVRWELDTLEMLELSDDAARAVAELRSRTDTAWTAYGDVKDAWRAQSDAVMRFSGETLSHFARQVSKNADFEHDGEACQPSGLQRVCTELKTVSERLAELLQTDE